MPLELLAVITVVLIMPTIYVGARIACTAYFHAKFEYQRKLLSHIDKGAM